MTYNCGSKSGVSMCRVSGVLRSFLVCGISFFVFSSVVWSVLPKSVLSLQEGVGPESETEQEEVAWGEPDPLSLLLDMEGDLASDSSN